MGLDELRNKFIVDEDVLKSRLESIIEKALKHCVVDRDGQVHVNSADLSARDRIMLILAARAIASQLEAGIAAEVTVGEISKFTALPDNQVRARSKELINDKLVESTRPGVYAAIAFKVEKFLDSLPDKNVDSGRRMDSRAGEGGKYGQGNHQVEHGRSDHRRRQ
jgi:hypothetical protein